VSTEGTGSSRATRQNKSPEIELLFCLLHYLRRQIAREGSKIAFYCLMMMMMMNEWTLTWH